jgi:hypothetical protein
LSSILSVAPTGISSVSARPPLREAPISSSSRMARRALAPTSSMRVFCRSSSSTTTIGSTTSCSSNWTSEWGSARRTQVSRTYDLSPEGRFKVRSSTRRSYPLGHCIAMTQGRQQTTDHRSVAPLPDRPESRTSPRGQCSLSSVVFILQQSLL